MKEPVAMVIIRVIGVWDHFNCLHIQRKLNELMLVFENEF